ncbi:MAG: hypothetical protein PF450_11790, partial [Bacteroidales bacterium]|nr:hypothetical protein [Bacteroidales bacterium]
MSGKTNKKNETKPKLDDTMETYIPSVNEKSFTNASGTFDIDRAIANLDSDAHNKNYTRSERKVMKRTLTNMKADARGDRGIGVIKDDKGLAWSWNEADDSEGRKGGVTDAARKNIGFGGKGVLGLSGDRYDEAYDFMVRNDYVKFKDQQRAKHVEPQKTADVIVKDEEVADVIVTEPEILKTEPDEVVTTTNKEKPKNKVTTTTPPQEEIDEDNDEDEWSAFRSRSDERKKTEKNLPKADEKSNPRDWKTPLLNMAKVWAFGNAAFEEGQETKSTFEYGADALKAIYATNTPSLSEEMNSKRLIAKDAKVEHQANLERIKALAAKERLKDIAKVKAEQARQERIDSDTKMFTPNNTGKASVPPVNSNASWADMRTKFQKAAHDYVPDDFEDGSIRYVDESGDMIIANDQVGKYLYFGSNKEYTGNKALLKRIFPKDVQKHFWGGVLSAVKTAAASPMGKKLIGDGIGMLTNKIGSGKAADAVPQSPAQTAPNEADMVQPQSAEGQMIINGVTYMPIQANDSGGKLIKKVPKAQTGAATDEPEWAVKSSTYPLIDPANNVTPSNSKVSSIPTVVDKSIKKITGDPDWVIPKNSYLTPKSTADTSAFKKKVFPISKEIGVDGNVSYTNTGDKTVNLKRSTVGEEANDVRGADGTKNGVRPEQIVAEKGGYKGPDMAMAPVIDYLTSKPQSVDVPNAPHLKYTPGTVTNKKGLSYKQISDATKNFQQTAGRRIQSANPNAVMSSAFSKDQAAAGLTSNNLDQDLQERQRTDEMQKRDENANIQQFNDVTNRNIGITHQNKLNAAESELESKLINQKRKSELVKGVYNEYIGGRENEFSSEKASANKTYQDKLAILKQTALNERLNGTAESQNIANKALTAHTESYGTTMAGVLTNHQNTGKVGNFITNMLKKS